MKLVARLTADKLRPGMRVSREPVLRIVDTEVIPDLTGSCEHGFHFGNACYDFIGQWYVYRV